MSAPMGAILQGEGKASESAKGSNESHLKSIVGQIAQTAEDTVAPYTPPDPQTGEKYER
jgi:hypothetical protein